jgi:hypothetical protein
MAQGSCASVDVRGHSQESTRSPKPQRTIQARARSSGSISLADGLVYDGGSPGFVLKGIIRSFTSVIDISAKGMNFFLITGSPSN